MAANAGPFSSFKRSVGRSKLLKLKRRLTFYKQMARSADRGFDIKQPILQLAERAAKRGYWTQPALREWVAALDNGERFNSVLAGAVPDAERMAIAAGEDTGQVGQGFRNAAFVTETAKRIKGELFKSLAYPAVLLVAFVVLLIVVSTMLIPTLLEIQPLDEWPVIARALYYVSQFTLGAGPWIAGGLAAGLAVALASLPRWQGHLRRQLDQWLVPFSIYRQIQSANMLVTLAALMDSGLPTDEAMRRMQKSASKWLRWHVERVIESVSQGLTTAEALDTGLHEDQTVDDLLMYDRTGDLAMAATEIGRDTVERTIESVGLFGKLAMGIIIVMVGIGVVWTYGAFVLVMMSSTPT